MADVSARERWAEAGRAIQARMDELGLTQFDVAARSGVSLATIREMVHARPRQRSPRTLSAVSKALGWRSGGLASILHGMADSSAEPNLGDELRAMQPEQQPSTEYLALSERLDQIEAQVGHIAEQVSQMEAGPPDSAGLASRLERIEADLASITGQVDQLAEHAGHYDELSHGLAQMKQSLAHLGQAAQPGGADDLPVPQDRSERG